MKDLWKSGVIVLLVIGVLYILFLRECKKPEPCPAEGEMIIPIDAWKKIQELANAKPTIHIDTVYIKGDIVYLPAKPLPTADSDSKDSTVNSYTDSLVQKDINAWYKFKVRGKLLERKWSYKPTFTIVKEIDSIPYPKIVEIDKPYEIAKGGLYIYGMAGGNANSFLFGGGIDYITKKETELGYMYQRFGSQGFHSIKLGGRLKIGKD